MYLASSFSPPPKWFITSRKYTPLQHAVLAPAAPLIDSTQLLMGVSDYIREAVNKDVKKRTTQTQWIA